MHQIAFQPTGSIINRDGIFFAANAISMPHSFKKSKFNLHKGFEPFFPLNYLLVRSLL